MILVVTGASKGLGRAISVAACGLRKHFVNGERNELHAVLVARSQDGLLETERLMIKANNNSNGSNESIGSNNNAPCHLKVTTHSMDLADLDSLDDNIDTLLQSVRSSNDGTDNNNDDIVLINNAGSIGHIGPTKDSSTLQDMRREVDFNITSALWLSTRFAREFQNDQSQSRCTLVQISSLVAIADFPSLAIYSAGKAARDRFHSVFAKETCDNNTQHFKVLNYAPGPLETDMVGDIRNSENLDESLREAYSRPQLDPMDSAKKLIQVLSSNEFESGIHLDYFDVPDN